MNLPSLLIVLAMLAVAFAGCSDGGDDGDGTTTSTSASRSTSSTATSTSRSSTGSGSSSSSSGSAHTNAAPTGSISAAVNGTNVTFSLTGTDPDGDSLNWTLDFGDGSTPAEGDALPATSTHPYASEGNFTANFTLSDGQEEISYDLVVPVVGGGGSGGIVFTAKQSQPSNPASSADAQGAFAGANACAGFMVGQNGVSCVWFDGLAQYAGRAFTATTDAGDPDYEFWFACPFADAVAAQEPLAPAGSNAAGPEAGEIPDGVDCIVLWTKGPEAPTHTVTVF